MVAPSIEEFVRHRAAFRCEYCRIPQEYVLRAFHIDHIHAYKHVDDDSPSNLAYACPRCNGCKGPNIAGLHPKSREVVRLFNPRTDVWREHFEWRGAVIVGRTDIGLVTVHVLDMNERQAVQLRAAIMRLDLFFP